MESSSTGWWHRHGWTVALLLSAFSISFLIRTVFMAALIQQFGPLNLYGGGSDSFYHSRVMEFIVLNHHNLVLDTSLNYPNGAINPREPLFDWMNAVLGIIFAPFFGGNAVKAGAFFLDLQGPLWAALGVVPVYLIGKEVSSRRMGLVAAFLYPLLVANIDSSSFGYANYLSFYTFFILITIFGYLRTVRSAGTRRWVESYRKPGDIRRGLRGFLRTERTTVKWAFFTGVSFGTLALAWQGYTFAVAVIIVFLIFAMVVERIRRVDSFSIYVSTWIIGLVGFPMALPYYLPQGLALNWFGLPALLFFGAMLVIIPFLLLRDNPWVVSVPVLILSGAAAVAALYFLNRNFFTNIVTGQGYFVKTLVYSTVAEAQAPSIDALILGYGVVTFFLAFVGLALIIWGMIRHRFRRVEMMFVVFAVASIYLPISAAKFFFLGSAVFALLPAEALVRALDIGGYPALRRNVASLSDRRSQFSAFRRSIKLRHIFILLLVVGLVLPNVWYAIDAGVPYNLKSQYNKQIYNSLPAPFQPVLPSASSNFFLGAAGTQLDTPTQYDENGYDWLASQDANLPAPQRPAFISWWDYGFQAVSEGKHPTVADNFQNGIVPAGNFLLAQNETQAIGILTTTLLTAEAKSTGQPTLPSSLNSILAADGVNLTTLHSLMTNPSQDVQLVLAHPERYLAVDPNHLDGQNALYDSMAYFLASTLTASTVAQVYNDVQLYTHWSIRYAMVDSRLFPFSGTNTGIFYAPADLTDRVIGAGGAPTAYYSLTVTGSDGKQYGVNALPAGVTAVNYNINYLPAFYQSMIYRTFIGYAGLDVGQAQGIPGLSQGALQSDPIMPGWMLQHFRVVYRTAYLCPFSDPNAHPGCFAASNTPDARALAKKNNWTADTSPSGYFQGGETILQYYAGQPMTGTVSLPDGTPVSQARVTVYDEWGIPHMTVTTGLDGAYAVVLPPGNDTVNVTTGPVNALVQAGTTSLATVHVVVPPALGLNPSAPTIVQSLVLSPARVQGFLYWNAVGNTTFIPKADPLVTGAVVTVWGPGLAARTATTDASGSFLFGNLPPGVYNFSVRVAGSNYTNASWKIFAGAGKLVNQTEGISPASVSGRTYFANGIPAAGATVQASNATRVIATATTNATGAFSLTNLAPGNYSLSARSSTGGLGSPPAAFSVSKAGQKLHANLTLVPIVQVSLTVVAAGNPVPAFPVRFTPIVALSPPPVRNTTGNTTGGRGGPGPASGSPAQTNSTVYFTDASGGILAWVPAGNYSIYGLGLVNGQWQSAFASAYVSTTPGPVILAPLFLSPAAQLSGHAALTAGNTPTGPTQVTAYNARGDQVSTYPNTTGVWSLWLPYGNYSISAVEGATTARSPIFAALTQVVLTGSATLDLTLGPAVRLNALVGSPNPSSPSGVFAAFQAAVQVVLSPHGGTVTALANRSGNVSLVVPASILGGQSYCVTANAFGFEPFSSCGLTSSQLAQMGTIPLRLFSVPVNVTVSGVPNAAHLTLNFTANSSTAQSVTVSGGPTFSLSLEPGIYRVTGWAPSPVPPGFFLPVAIETVNIPVGARSDNLSFSVIYQVHATGDLVLPTNLVNSSVTVHLFSPRFNVTLGGSQFEGRFFAPPGSYQVYAQGSYQNQSYATLSSVTINGTGAVVPSVTLATSGSRVNGTLLKPDGTIFSSSVAFNLSGPNGFTLPVNAIAGRFSLLLPLNLSFNSSVSTTQLVPTPSGPRYEQFTSVAGHPCVTSARFVNCSVPLAATNVVSWFNGTLSYAGFPSGVAGTVRLVGPFPSTNVTSVTTPDGAFRIALLPGTYSLYATSSEGGSPLANASQLVVPPSGASPTTVLLHPTWSVTLTLTAPSGPNPPSSATVWIHGGNAVSVTFTGVPLNTPESFALPVGVYSVQANATGAPFGLPTNATAVGSVALIGGNAATQLTLSYTIVHTATLTLLSPTHLVVSGGTRVTYSFVVTNTGNAPETLTFVGTPSFWNFTFTPANVTLGLTNQNRTASVQVSILVPVATPVAHPTVQIEAVLASTGTVAGFVSPLPDIAVLPYIGLTLTAGPASGAVIGPLSAAIPISVLDTGNFPEGVSLTVSDAARLAGLGWAAKIVSGKAPVPAVLVLQPGANTTFEVQLSAPSGHAMPAGSVTVLAHVVNGSGTLNVYETLSVPAVPISVNSSTLYVTGPGIGSPSSYPTWLVPLLCFVPALALVGGVIAYRWWRTRRWTRR